MTGEGENSRNFQTHQPHFRLELLLKSLPASAAQPVNLSWPNADWRANQRLPLLQDLRVYAALPSGSCDWDWRALLLGEPQQRRGLAPGQGTPKALLTAAGLCSQWLWTAGSGQAFQSLPSGGDSTGQVGKEPAINRTSAFLLQKCYAFSLSRSDADTWEFLLSQWRMSFAYCLLLHFNY